MSIQQVKLIHRAKNGKLYKHPATLEFVDGRIYFLKSPFALKDEIKAMSGSRWHGFDKPPRSVWSVDDCFRNKFQLGFLMGENVYEWFDRPLVEHQFRDYRRCGKPADPMKHQFEMANSGLTYHYQIWAAEMGTGKSLAAQMTIEHSGVNHWYWAGPKSSLPNMQREFRMWDFQGNFLLHEGLDKPDELTVEAMTYERLVRLMDEWKPGDPLPQGLICDESSRCKTWSSQRTRAVNKLACLIREHFQFDGYVIEMSGTPSPKKPTDWWAQCEVAWPGFVREGSPEALERRLSWQSLKQFDSGTFYQRDDWKDDAKKCEKCGKYEEDPVHHNDNFMEEDGGNGDYHTFQASKDEVSYMYERLKGLVVVKSKKECLDLPDKHYRTVVCKPSKSVLRVASALVESAPNAVTGMTLLRELSDGFQYREKQDGMMPCSHCPGSCGEVDEWFIPGEEHRVFKAIDMLDEELVSRLEKRKAKCPKCKGQGEVPRMVRITRAVPCPKEAALRDLLEENEETGRIVVFAGFTGSVDRCCDIVRKEGWCVVRCDGRGFQVTREDGTTVVSDSPLDFWADIKANPRVAFVAHPESGGMSLTLTEAHMIVYWSNSFKPEYRVQSEDRIHRKGMDLNKGATIVDLIHLPSDDRVLEIIRENRKLELMTMGQVFGNVNWNVAA